MGLKNGRSTYEPDIYVKEGEFVLDSDNPTHMDVQHNANEMVKRGDVQGAHAILTLNNAIKVRTPIAAAPKVTLGKRNNADVTVSENNTKLIKAYIDSGYKLKS